MHQIFSFPVDDVTDLCPFPIQFSGQVAGHVEAFYDEAGNFIKVILHFSNTFTLSANGGSLSENDHYTEFDVGFDGGGAPSTIITTGLMVHIRVPGEGTVRLEGGRIVVDTATDTVVFQAGNFVSSEDTAVLCAALS